MFVYGVGFGVWMRVECPCPPVRNDIVTPRHLFLTGKLVATIISKPFLLQPLNDSKFWCQDILLPNPDDTVATAFQLLV